MSFRSDSLFHRLTEAQRDELMVCISEASKDRFAVGLGLCEKWEVKASRTAVYDFYKRYSFGWRLERGAAAAQFTRNFSTFEEDKRKLVAQKLFAELTDADCDPKLLVLIRSMELEEDKIKQRGDTLEHHKEKFRESLRTKLEAGMNALFEQIKENPVAMEAFGTMKAALTK